MCAAVDKKTSRKEFQGPSLWLIVSKLSKASILASDLNALLI